MLKVFLAVAVAAQAVNFILMPFWLPGIPSWMLMAQIAALAAVTAVVLFVARSSIAAAYRRRRLSPERIMGYRSPTDVEQSPYELSRSIVERASEIRRSLEDSPSELEAEMCALGYRACVNDMITLTNLVNERSGEAALIERLRLRLARRRATSSLAKARQSLPADALRATRQEQP